jgi:hypothetical protein
MCVAPVLHDCVAPVQLPVAPAILVAPLSHHLMMLASGEAFALLRVLHCEEELGVVVREYMIVAPMHGGGVLRKAAAVEPCSHHDIFSASVHPMQWCHHAAWHTAAVWAEMHP